MGQVMLRDGTRVPSDAVDHFKVMVQDSLNALAWKDPANEKIAILMYGVLKDLCTEKGASEQELEFVANDLQANGLMEGNALKNYVIRACVVNVLRLSDTGIIYFDE